MVGIDGPSISLRFPRRVAYLSWEVVLDGYGRKTWIVSLVDGTLRCPIFHAAMVIEAKQHLSGAGLGFAFAEIDAQLIPFEDESFDAILANHMLYHVPDRERALLQIHRVLRSKGRFYAATNGRNHLRELKELIAKFDSDALSYFDRESFNLENGATELSRWFAEVKLKRRDGALVVTEAMPLVEYAKSFRRFSYDALDELQAYVEGEIRSKGAVRITTATGLFAAVKR